MHLTRSEPTGITMIRAACILGTILLLTPLHAEPTPRVDRSFGTAFQKEQATGTLAILDPTSAALRVWNPERAKQRFIPASTFKIANALIGLDTGTVKSPDEILPYGGKPQLFKEWEHDMSLKDGMRVSAVPIYQELARRIGPERMAAGVKALNYGNMETGKVIDRFWLDGPLTISATEQVEFIRRLLADELPLKKETMQQVRAIVSTEKFEHGTVHFKTGWCTATKPQIGWIVGWVTWGGTHTPFALNIDMSGLDEAPKRMAILKECLLSLGPPPWNTVFFYPDFYTPGNEHLRKQEYGKAKDSPETQQQAAEFLEKTFTGIRLSLLQYTSKQGREFTCRVKREWRIEDAELLATYMGFFSRTFPVQVPRWPEPRTLRAVLYEFEGSDPVSILTHYTFDRPEIRQVKATRAAHGVKIEISGPGLMSEQMPPESFFEFFKDASDVPQR
ncbi:class D beta-lactamase [Luteolibacter sp. GHJ8]|uniref:Beta-lactamase n=1 Tax=Luteolibacter rhizosphaerae TaxID=2989719 RepID=A0ABT3G9X0_9BACT|nr:class D beta-lactamase [Luteolibacter rhizosphaerae]MCW1916647.1 class D beta-lactamase [Luteolibacter rhizosphaerae]